MKQNIKETRKHGRHLRVPVLAEEEAAIKEQAAKSGLSVSAYLRKIGLGYPINSALDYQAVETLAKVNADLGRLGGLLKMWLTNDEKLKPFESIQIDETIVGLVHTLRERQNELREIIEMVVRQ